ncbi:MAG TPA: hypothetical protein VEV82_05845, partial [Actinomycetota bacterium]|nr:hypothetical protein [Actinomycetota bacterium]
MISSYLDPDDLDLMGLWDWIDSKPGLSQANKNALRAMIEAGTHWMFTPFRKLRLIHAVRQPLVSPVFNDLKVEKQLGKTFASLRDISTISRKSTERIDVRGSWTDVTDFLDAATGVWEPTKQTAVDAVAFQVPIPLVGSESEMIVDGRHEFHDTHYRNVDYSEVATTRFREFFVERQEIMFVAEETHDLETQWPGPAAGDNGLGVLPESEVVKSPDGGTTFVRDTDYEMDYPAGTIKRKAGGDMPPHFTAN